MFYVYILKSEKNGKYYIGYTSNLDERIKRHNQGREKSTRSRRPFTVEYYKEYSNKGEAIRYERYLKSLKSHKYVQKLIKKAKWDVSSTG